LLKRQRRRASRVLVFPIFARAIGLVTAPWDSLRRQIRRRSRATGQERRNRANPAKAYFRQATRIATTSSPEGRVRKHQRINQSSRKLPMTDKPDIERRTFVQAITAASGAALMGGLLPQRVAAQSPDKAAPAASDHFETAEIKAGDNTIFIRRYGKGSPLLMVHGFPRTSLMWRYVAPHLASNHTVICVDLRGYGRSGVPASAEDHYPYSKRAMADELVEVMDKLGFDKFDLVGHDRGGRVSYRLALDHPDKVRRLAVFDVIPISEGWGHADAKFAMTYWPWILLSQRAPLPEKYLLGAPGAVFDNPFGAGSFDHEVREEYTETYRDPSRVHAICEEYRAAATIDIEHDKADQKEGRRITCPMLHLWAIGGPLDTFYAQEGGALGIWRKWADNVHGQAIKGGHFFPEENPTETTEILTRFLSEA
jgi:haloacetate dehalogenase